MQARRAVDRPAPTRRTSCTYRADPPRVWDVRVTRASLQNRRVIGFFLPLPRLAAIAERTETVRCKRANPHGPVLKTANECLVGDKVVKSSAQNTIRQRQSGQTKRAT